MEWRQQSSVSCADAFTEARRWIEVRGLTDLTTVRGDREIASNS